MNFDKIPEWVPPEIGITDPRDPRIEVLWRGDVEQLEVELVLINDAILAFEEGHPGVRRSYEIVRDMQRRLQEAGLWSEQQQEEFRRTAQQHARQVPREYVEMIRERHTLRKELAAYTR